MDFLHQACRKHPARPNPDEGKRPFTLNILIPRQTVPALDLPLIDGSRFNLSVTPAPTFTMLVFYRWLHCPLCAKYLIELEKLHDDFIQPGVRPLGICSDTEVCANTTADKAVG